MQIALQPKSTVAVAPFFSRDALRNPQTAQQIQQFYDSVPVIPPECDATTAGAHCFGDPGLRSQLGPFYNSLLKPDARVLPPFDDVAAAFFVWYSQLGTCTDRIIDYMPLTTISSVPSLTTVWPSQCGTSDTSGLLPGVAGRITRPGFWRRRRRSQARQNLAIWGPSGLWFAHSKGKRKRLVPRPVVDSAGVPATEPFRVAELMGELLCTEFGHRVKIDSLDDHSLSSSRRERPCPFEVPSVADVQAALEPLTGLLKIEFGNHLVSQRAAFYKRKGITSAIIFLDMTAAFYRALPELVLGPLLDEKAGAVLLGAPSSCGASRIQAAILDWGTPQWLHGAIADWHTDTFFRVRHAERTYRPVSWVRPGDPLADLIFNVCMTGFIKELRKYLVEDGLLVRMQDLDGNPLQPAWSEDDQDRGVTWIWIAPRGWMITLSLPLLGTPTM